MRARLERLRTTSKLALVGLVAVVGSVAISSQFARGDSVNDQAQQAMAGLFPGASSTLVADPATPGGSQLQITLPGVDLSIPNVASVALLEQPPGSQPGLRLEGGLHLGLSGASLQATLPGLLPAAPEKASVEQQFDYANIGWVLSMVSATVAQTEPELTSYRATIAGSVPDAAGDGLQGVVRLSPGDDLTAGMTQLASISQQAAIGQLQANLTTLRNGLASPQLAGQLGQAVVTVVPINKSGTQFALAFDLTVQNLPALESQFGNILDGLATGLTGGQTATIEGLTINVHDANGARISSWQAPRAQTGELLATSGIDLPSTMVVTLPFTSVTGGPAPASSAFGAAGGSSALSKPITVRSGSTRVRAEGSVCPPNAGCGGAGLHRGMKRPLVLCPRRALVIQLPYLARRVSVALVDGSGNDRWLAHSRSLPHGGWRLQLPKQLHDPHAVFISVQPKNTDGEVSYFIGARASTCR